MPNLTRFIAVAFLLATSATIARSQENLSGIPVDHVAAVVGSRAILFSDVWSEINQRRAAGMPMPPDSASLAALMREVVDELVDEELLIQYADRLAIELTDQEIRGAVDQQIQRVRQNFGSEEALVSALREAGFEGMEDYRRNLTDDLRRQELQRRVVGQLRQERRLPAVSVTEQDVTTAFTQYQDRLGRRPATVTFRQVVIPPQPAPEAKAAARARADSIRAELDRGGDFENIARRESMDEATRNLGGDLGWTRRGLMVPQFEQWIFNLRPGVISPVFETVFGFHIVRVDRRQPAEVRARHILIRPRIDSADVARTRSLADSVADVWRAGAASFDTLVARFHDPNEERGVLSPFPSDSLPIAYQEAFRGVQERQIVGPFAVGTADAPKFIVAQLLTMTDAGEYTVADLRQLIRQQLIDERSIRRFLDNLRRETYVSIRI